MSAAPVSRVAPATVPSDAPAGARLRARALTVGYRGTDVLHGLDLDVLDDQLTVVVGPNACGKSTLLRTLARVLPARSGAVELDGRDVHRMPPKELARELGMLTQAPVAPDGIAVRDLVARGRYPHQTFLRQWTREDDEAVTQALAAADVTALADAQVDELSGGQRQRVWIAMALAQRTPILLLDEPTTYLDLAHQLDVLDLARRLHREGRTVVVVLHELNLAFRYATHLVLMRDGRVVAQGAPRDVVTAELVEEVYDVPCLVVPDPVTGTPLVVPRERSGPGAAP